MMRLAVTGTDTGVGKTIVAAALLTMLRRDGLRVAAMKPVDAEGVYGDEASDADLLLAAAGVWAFDAAWPDRLVALGLAMLLLRSGFGVLRDAAHSTR